MDAILFIITPLIVVTATIVIYEIAKTIIKDWIQDVINNELKK